jgi:hypothetical protein
MTISYLADHSKFVSVLAPEIAAHWQPYLLGETVEKRIAKLLAHMSTDTLPIAWVAHDGGEVVGTAALRAGRMSKNRVPDCQSAESCCYCNSARPLWPRKHDRRQAARRADIGSILEMRMAGR